MEYRRITRRIVVILKQEPETLLVIVLVIGIVVLSLDTNGAQPLKIILTAVFAFAASVMVWMKASW